MGIIKKRPYYFSDSSIASDTVLAFVMGGISLVIEIAGIITSFATFGHVPDIFGTLCLCALILSIVGLVFAFLGKKAQEGGVKGKRMSVIVNVLSLVILLWLFLLGV